MPEEKTSQKSAREPQALSSEYHKARKQLMLWAGILFIWELVGIDLEKAKEAGGTAGAIITAIKSPQAVPWVLLILVAYFAFKLRVEWRQCNKFRREVAEAKQDCYSAWAFATVACLLYFGQTISRVQFADVVENSSRSNSFFRGMLVGVFTMFGACFVWHARNWKSYKRALGVFGALALLLLDYVFTLRLLRYALAWRLAIPGFLLGILVGWLGFFFLRAMMRRILDDREIARTFDNAMRDRG